VRSICAAQVRIQAVPRPHGEQW